MRTFKSYTLPLGIARNRLQLHVFRYVDQTSIVQFDQQIPQIQNVCFANNIAAPILIMDNCRIHHGDDVSQLFADANIRLIYLPPYCPTYNPIETAFSKFKSMIRRWATFLEASGFSDYQIIDHAFATLTPENCAQWIAHACY